MKKKLVWKSPVVCGTEKDRVFGHSGGGLGSCD